MLTSSAVCQWSPGSLAAWFAARGGPLPALSPPPRVRNTATTPTMITMAMATFQPKDPLRRRLGLRYLERMAARCGRGGTAGWRVRDCGMASRRLPADLRRLGAGPERPRGEVHQRSYAEEEHEQRQQQTVETAPTAGREPVHGPVVLHDHAVRPTSGAGALHVQGGARGVVRHPPPDPAQPPAQVDVLHVH